MATGAASVAAVEGRSGPTSGRALPLFNDATPTGYRDCLVVDRRGSEGKAMSIRLIGIILLLGSFVSSVVPAGPAAATASDAVLAKALNMTQAELPQPTKWTASPQTPNTSAQTALGVKAVGCVRTSSSAGGKVGTDPFGTTEVVGGTVTADVESPTFASKGSSAGLPSAGSEVVMLKSASQAANDLSAFASTPARACFTSLLVAVLKSEGSGKLKVAASPQALPHLGTGRGGFGLRYVVTGSQLPGPLIDYTYFYVQGRAEIDLEFTNLNTQFSTAWANAIAVLVMARARSLLG
jgi:hypothetical protein